MNYTKQILSFICIGILLTLAGCAKKNSYKPNKLLSLKESAHVDYEETKDQVTVRAKAFSKNDSEYVFGERADRICGEKDPLQPIQLCIENKSNDCVKLLESSIDLQLVSSKEITKRIGSRSKFLASGIVGGIGLCGIVAGICAVTSAVWPCELIVAALIIGFGGLVTLTSPFVLLIENWGTSAENCKIRNYIHEINVGKEIVIKPGAVIDMLVFVKKSEYKPQFKCVLISDKKREIPFMVKLK